MLDFESNPINEEELKRQRDRIMRAPLVIRDNEYLFRTCNRERSGAVDTNLAMMAKVSLLIEVLCLAGSYKLVHQLWAQIVLSAGALKWTRGGHVIKI